MSNERTYLETFIESIGTLPSELRRNLNHIRSLDQTYALVVQELRELEHSYLVKAHDSITDLNVSFKDEIPARKKQKKESNASLEEEENESVEGASDQEMNPFWWKPKEGIVHPKNGEVFLPTTEDFRQRINDPKVLLHIATLRDTARQLVEEKIAVSKQSYTLIDNNILKLESDLEQMEELLKNTGQYENVIAEITPPVQPNELAAIQVTPNSSDWILAKVISHDPKTGIFKLSDEDIESNKTFVLPEAQVVILGGVDRVAKGESIYAVYPDTTSFYQATVVQIPKKSPNGELCCMVHFKDDGDEHGVTHEKPVLMKHVMRLPTV
jgi:LysM repeat protein